MIPVNLGVVVLQALTNLLLLKDKTPNFPCVGHTSADNLILNAIRCLSLDLQAFVLGVDDDDYGDDNGDGGEAEDANGAVQTKIRKLKQTTTRIEDE